MLAGRRCLVTTVQSDSHTWNLIYMQLLIEEFGATVINLGGCAPVAETISAIKQNNPDLVVVSSVNGHGYFQGKELIEKVTQKFPKRQSTFVIGGKLSTSVDNEPSIDNDLRSAGYDAIFQGIDAIPEFRKYLKCFSNAPLTAIQ